MGKNGRANQGLQMELDSVGCRQLGSVAYLTQLSSVVTQVLTPVSYIADCLGCRCLSDLWE